MALFDITLIKSIDDEAPQPSDVNAIRDGKCLNCEEKYDGEEPIRFANLSKGRLLWWHLRHCAFEEKPALPYKHPRDR